MRSGRKVADLTSGPVGDPGSNGKHKFKRTVPKNLYGNYKVRTRFISDDGHITVDTSQTIRVVKRVPPIAKKYRNTVTDVDPGHVLRFNACDTVTIRYDDKALPSKKRKAALADLKWSANQMTKLTKTPYKVVGKVNKRKPAKIFVKWGNPKGDALGIAYLKKFRHVSGNYWEITRTAISLDKRALAKDRNLRRSTMVHELMHVAGRGHAKQSTGNIMTPRARANEKFKATAADRYAMKRLGRGYGCL
ncbi:hypothetical protein [Aeromicrobium sp. 179-A 4D2 NHS]|uniref:hypothetical protein n=1 Tax=Aeromicrobium sp. 179-A 4D2 NHS TaxID=3142375 RepID=UPI0039A38199